jgi:hypothetical protein
MLEREGKGAGLIGADVKFKINSPQVALKLFGHVAVALAAGEDDSRHKEIFNRFLIRLKNFEHNRKRIIPG